MLLHNHQELKFTMPSIMENVKQFQLVIAKQGTTTLALPTKAKFNSYPQLIQFCRSVMSDSVIHGL